MIMLFYILQKENITERSEKLIISLNSMFFFPVDFRHVLKDDCYWSSSAYWLWKKILMWLQWKKWEKIQFIFPCKTY